MESVHAARLMALIKVQGKQQSAVYAAKWVAPGNVQNSAKWVAPGNVQNAAKCRVRSPAGANRHSNQAAMPRRKAAVAQCQSRAMHRAHFMGAQGNHPHQWYMDKIAQIGWLQPEICDGEKQIHTALKLVPAAVAAAVR